MKAEIKYILCWKSWIKYSHFVSVMKLNEMCHFNMIFPVTKRDVQCSLTRILPQYKITQHKKNKRKVTPLCRNVISVTGTNLPYQEQIEEQISWLGFNLHHAGLLTMVGQINAQLRANQEIYEA